MARFTKKNNFFVVLKCSECKDWNDTWELTNFMRQLGHEYKRQGYVTQYCGCSNSNTEHHIMGLVENRQIPLTATRVFSRYEKGRKR